MENTVLGYVNWSTLLTTIQGLSYCDSVNILKWQAFEISQLSKEVKIVKKKGEENILSFHLMLELLLEL